MAARRKGPFDVALAASPGADRAPATGDVARLDPEKLAPIAEEAMRDLLAEGESANTVRSYEGALRYWTAWFSLRFQQRIALPVPVPAVLQFIVDHAQRKNSSGLLECGLPQAVDEALVGAGCKAALGAPALATLLHRISVLSKVHRLKELPNPCQNEAVRELLSKTRRAYAKRGGVRARKPALTKDPLEAILATCDDTLRGVRDRALILFGWASGGRRRSEVVAATMGNVRKVGERAYLYTLGSSKTHQAGGATGDADKPILGAAADALEAWLARAKITEGAIFRRVRRGDRIGEPLSASAVNEIVKLRVAAAGFEKGFSAHSLRSGFVTEAARQNVPIGETMAMTGHVSVTSVVGYFRTADALNSGAGRLLDGANSD